MSERPAAILERFPLHLAATDPGKRFGGVVTALAGDLDVLSRQLRDVRTAHRVTEAPTSRDLLGLAALHRVDDGVLALLGLRIMAIRAAATAEPPDPELLARLLGVPEDVLSALTNDGDALAAALVGLDRHRGRLELQRGVVLAIVQAHVIGNATPSALLAAAAGYLGLQVDDVRHAAGNWWHLATCSDRLRLVPPPPVPDPPEPPPEVPPEPLDLTPEPDVLALEENPFRPADIAPSPKRTGQRTRVLRGGLQDVDVTIRVLGLGDRTVRPLVVHLGSGRGVGFEGTVPNGSELAFRSNGRVTLDGGDVTGSAWSFVGAVFADAAQALSGDDVAFTAADGTLPTGTTLPSSTTLPSGTGKPARFAEPAPLDAFTTTPPVPHGAATVGPLQLPRGESRWASLVRVARTGGRVGDPVAPRPMAGRFDAAVFAAGAGETDQPCLDLGFAWEEREPFAVRVLLPRRFSGLDDDAGTLLRLPLTRLLDRHRAAGVDLRVEYADPRWNLGEGITRTATDDALGVVLSGTELWPDGTPQPDSG